MKHLKGVRPSPALFVSMIALVMAMSGAAIAAKATVTSSDIKKAAVTTQKLANGAVTKKKVAKGAIGSQQIIGKSIKGNRIKDGGIKDKQIADATITGAKVADESLSSKNISDYAVISSDAGNFVKLTATEGANEAAARDAAPETTLFEKGSLKITAKCFRDTGGDETFAEIYIATNANGAIFDGSTDELSGGNAATDFLNTDTAFTDRVLDDDSSTGADASMDEGEFNAVGPDGTHLVGQTTVASKNGNLAGGNGVYGDGNVCLFGGEIAG
jgi:hypothetical protein